jgi:hypothetical protein
VADRAARERLFEVVVNAANGDKKEGMGGTIAVINVIRTVKAPGKSAVPR